MEQSNQKFKTSPVRVNKYWAKNKKLSLFLIIILLIGIYLFWAHFFIYYRLEQADLSPIGRQPAYIIGDNQANSSNLVYVALGDSLTAGVGASKYEEAYPYLLAEKLAKDKQSTVTLKNFSQPGVKTSQLIVSQIDSAVDSQPDIISLLIGTNDVHGNISASDFKKNYEYILTRLTQETSAKIYLLGLHNVGSDGLLLPPYNYYFRQKTRNNNQIIQVLADKYGLTYIDLEKITLSAVEETYYSKDLFHPSAYAYQLWAQIIYGNISK